MRDALSLLDQVLVSSGAAVTLDAARAALGVVPREAVDEVARAAGEGDAGRALLAVAAVVDAGREPTEVIDALVEHFRNLLWLSVLPEGAPPPDAALPDVPALREAAGAWGTDTLLAVLRLLLETRREARGSELARFHLELAIVRITRLRDLLPIETILERLKDLERRLGEGGLAAPAGGRAPAAGLFDATPAARPAPASGPAPAPRAPAAPPAKEKGSGTFSAAEKVPDPFSPAAPPPAGAAVDWPSVVRSLGQSSPGLAAQLGSAREGGLQGDTFTLYFPASSRFLMESVQKTANKRMVEDALARVAGGRVVLRCQEAPEEPAGPESQGRPSGEVRKLIERFGGEIQPPPGR
jgi:DNA polymerase-3 subunit gamma/tau